MEEDIFNLRFKPFSFVKESIMDWTELDFIAGANWQKEQDKVIIDKLKSSLVKIVNWHKVHEPLSFIDGNDLKEAELLLNSLK